LRIRSYQKIVLVRLTVCEGDADLSPERDSKNVMPLQFAFRPEDFFPQALGRADVVSCVRLAIFLQGAIDGFKRGVEVARLGVLVEKSDVDEGEVFLCTCPSERQVCARKFLQGLAESCDRFFEPHRPALQCVERSERSAEIVLGLGPFDRYAFAGPFLQGFAISLDSLFKLCRVAPPLAEVSKCIAAARARG
jgi:hypothetical protein